jgi:tetratricopeptide (TPR) repeat protein
MSRIFLSHSRHDDLEAVAVRDWLNENGWNEVVLDLDPAQDIHLGTRSERALRDNATSCEAVLFLISRNWLGSEWCRTEYELARKLNKRVFVALIEKLPVDDLPRDLRETHQVVSLVSGENNRLLHVTQPGTLDKRHVIFSTERLNELKDGLTCAGLDPRFFAWPPENESGRAPYRGLEPFEVVDAGIFFGRDAPLIEALDALRGLAEAAPPRLFVVLGGSGSGKSSFLRAGLWPRLARNDHNFMPLFIMRPGRAALSGANGFVAALADAAESRGLETTAAQIREVVAGGAGALRPLLRDLALRAAISAGGAKPPTLVVAIDQAEELFSAEGAVEGQSLLTLLRDLATMDDPAVIVLFAVRSDFYDALERAKPFEGMRQNVFALLPMSRRSYQMAIECPAERLAQTDRKFEIDPGLTQALLEDIENGGDDTLPLLAFTLEQLYRVCGATKRITHADYEQLGGLAGSIDAAFGRVFAAADADSRLPKDQEARFALLRRGLIPWLADVDPRTRTARRHIARAAQIPQEARPLIDCLVEQHMLVRGGDADTDEATLEPAHDALLRQWGKLKGWIEEEFERLTRLGGVKRASRDWDAHGRIQAWAAHGGARLEEAETLYGRTDLTALLDSTDRAYLAACIEKEKAAREAEEARRRGDAELKRVESQKLTQRARNALRVAWISSIGLAATLALMALAGSQWQGATKAKEETQAQRDRAEKTLALATDTANRLVLDLAQELRNDSSASAPLIENILSRASKLHEQLISGGANSNDQRRSLSVALNQVVDTYIVIDDTKDALAAAQRSVALMEALSDSNPSEAGWRRDLSVSYEKVGDVQKAQGDLNGALKSYRHDLAIAEALSTSDPGNAQWRWDLSISYEKVGDVQQAEGDLSGALESYHDSLAIREAVSASDPGNPGWRRDLAVSNERIAATLAKQNDVKGAIGAFEQALAIYQAAVRAHPDDTQSLAFSIVPHWRLAELDKARAREHLTAALAISESLAAAGRLDSKRLGWIREIKAQRAALDQPTPGPQSPAGPAKRKE